MPEVPRDVFVHRLASRDMRSENEIQADVYGLLTVGGLDLTEDQVARTEVGTGDGTRRRIDVAIGNLTIEVKKDLRPAGIVPDATQQLAGYVRNREELTGSDCAGVLTDGTTWILYHQEEGDLHEVSRVELSTAAPNVDQLVGWLEAILATQSQVLPTPESIRSRLGAGSPAHQYDHAVLASLFERASSIPEVQLKRELWAKLLRTAFGDGFADSERLFLDHTLLVLSAEIIAHAALGFDVSEAGGISPRAMTSGTAFVNAQIYGVVQADFFDWVLHVDGGEDLIRTLTKRIAQFDWTAVDHDVLKVLYESIIEAPERRRLGEYYTPDWLAERMVDERIDDPLSQRVLDPSCGSGTFLFHAVRRHLLAAENAGVDQGAAVVSATAHVIGLDIHPVAVTLARVTYLLALGADRLNAPTRGPVSIPVYLGDALQWEQRIDIFAHEGNVTVSTSGSDLAAGAEVALYEDDLIFPHSVVTDAGSFDRLVEVMAEKAADTSDRASRAVILPTLRQFGVHESDVDTLIATFHAWRALYANGRDHIWGYYVRNLIRPIWLAEPQNRVDVLIGNPPWLAFSKMTGAMQRKFSAMSRDRGLLTGNRGISGRDLSTLFVVRATELYLKDGGTLSFVMPQGTLTRQPHSSFRAGMWNGPSAGLAVQFGKPWDLSRAATGFPVLACVVHGTVSQQGAVGIGSEAELWVTRGSTSNVSWAEMQPRLSISDGTLGVTTTDGNTEWSPYKRRFRQGAVLSPRVLLFVEEAPSAPLGAGAGRIAVRSRRTSLEDRLWRDVASLTGVAERAFVRPIALGETTLPFRQTEPLLAVLPVKPDGSGLLSSSQIEDYAAMSVWWANAEDSFTANRTGSADETLLSRVDFHGQLSAQLPSATHRVVYTKAGNTLNASRIESTQTLIDHKLYWAAASSVDEARYLVAILNSQAVLDRVQPFQASGLFGARDFDKNVFRALIQPYDASNSDHVELAEVGRLSEETAATVELDGLRSFQAKRRGVRDTLQSDGLQQRTEALVLRVVPEARPI